MEVLENFFDLTLDELKVFIAEHGSENPKGDGEFYRPANGASWDSAVSRTISGC
jgi:hypothetical protein